MTKKKIFTTLGAVCLILLVATLIKAQTVYVPATCFTTQDNSGDWQIGWGGWGDYIWRQTGATETEAVAPVYLPDSVLIRNVRFHFVDNNALNAVMGITRVNKYTGAHTTVYLVNTTGASSAVRYLTDYTAPSPSQALTNSGALHWHAFIRYSGTDTSYATATFKFYGITIEYTPYP
jgi:hypothetical protein